MVSSLMMDSCRKIKRQGEEEGFIEFSYCNRSCHVSFFSSNCSWLIRRLLAFFIYLSTIPFFIFIFIYLVTCFGLSPFANIPFLSLFLLSCLELELEHLVGSDSEPNPESEPCNRFQVGTEIRTTLCNWVPEL